MELELSSSAGKSFLGSCTPPELRSRPRFQYPLTFHVNIGINRFRSSLHSQQERRGQTGHTSAIAHRRFDRDTITLRHIDQHQHKLSGRQTAKKSNTYQQRGIRQACCSATGATPLCFDWLNPWSRRRCGRLEQGQGHEDRHQVVREDKAGASEQHNKNNQQRKTSI